MNSRQSSRIGLALIIGALILIAQASRSTGQPTTKPSPAPVTQPSQLAVGTGDATQPSTQPRTIDQIMDDLGATDEQRAQVEVALEQASTDWRDWWSAHRMELKQLRERAKAAADARDSQTLSALQQRIQTIMNELPKSADLWPAVARAFQSRQQLEKLEAARKQSPSAFSRRLHAAVRGPDINGDPRGNPDVCSICHTPRFNI